MNTNKDIIFAIQNEYQDKQRRAKIQQIERKKQLYEKYPRLEEIDEKINKNYLMIIKNKVFEDGENRNRQLEKNIEKLKIQRQQYIFENKIDITKLDIKYECDICKDTGVIDVNGKVQRCQCFINRYNALLYENTNMLELIKNNNFEKFDLEIFDDKIKYDKLTQREFMEKIQKKSLSFIEKFEEKNEKSMIFYGATGLGKTFLCLCIAGRLINKKKNVIYDSAIGLFEKLSQYVFSSDKSDSESAMFYSLVNKCDLLIIDDLGTEMTNNFVKQELFEIVNQRIISNKKTIISTNLNMDEMRERYEQRIFSRFSSDYSMYRFVGKDVRLFKK